MPSRARLHPMAPRQQNATSAKPVALGFLDAVDGRDVRVVEAGEDLRLPREPGETVRVSREGVRQDFQVLLT